MALPEMALIYDLLGGTNFQHEGRAAQRPDLLECVDGSQNLISDPAGEWVTRPGFSHVRASAISGAPTITGMAHMKDVVDAFILATSAGKVYQDNASPPTEITLGTAFTSGATNLIRFAIHNDLLILASQSRDLPQTINASLTGANLGGTPARGLDVKSFFRRLCMFSPLYSSTTYPNRMSFTSANDDQTAWVAPIAVNSLRFGERAVLGGEVLGDFLFAFTADAVFRVYATPNATLPLAIQQNVWVEDGGGPPSIHSVVNAAGRLWWPSRNGDLKVATDDGLVRSAKLSTNVQPYLRGLADAYRSLCVGGFEPQYRMICWGVAPSGQTTNQAMLVYHVDTGFAFVHTLAVQALAARGVGGDPRLLGGHYNGLFSNLYDSSTVGDLQTAASTISAIARLPRLHHGQPGTKKKISYVGIEFDPISTETATVAANYDDDTGFTDVSASVAISGTDTATARIKTPQPYDRLQLQIRNAVANERMRVTRLGVPAPKATTVTAT